MHPNDSLLLQCGTILLTCLSVYSLKLYYICNNLPEPVWASPQRHFIFKEHQRTELNLPFTACSTWERLRGCCCSNRRECVWFPCVDSLFLFWFVRASVVHVAPLVWDLSITLACLSLSFSLIKCRMVAVARVLFRALNPASADLLACRSALSGECQRDRERYQGPRSYMDKPFVSVQYCEQWSDNVLPCLMGCG